MNSTNRILNRIFVFLIGLLVLTGGATLALVALVPLVRDSWTNATRVGIDRATRWSRATPLPESLVPVNGSWLWLIVLAAGALLTAGDLGWPAIVAELENIFREVIAS